MVELYQDEMCLKEFEARVVSVKDGKYVMLDRTAFYPRSGGVANDTGKLIRKGDGKVFDVVFVGKLDGGISHEIGEPGLEIGDRITGVIDWERRSELMRYHTAAHVLSGAFWNEGKVKISGNELDIGQGRIDFTFDDFDKELIESFVDKANEAIENDLPVEVYHISRDELDSDPDMVKLAVGLPDSIKQVRIVDIKGLDRQPDGGCHVRSLGEVGRITVTKMKNKGKSNRRMYFVLEAPKRP